MMPNKTLHFININIHEQLKINTIKGNEQYCTVDDHAYRRRNDPHCGACTPRGSFGHQKNSMKRLYIYQITIRQCQCPQHLHQSKVAQSSRSDATVIAAGGVGFGPVGDAAVNGAKPATFAAERASSSSNSMHVSA
jgi:hypothetical protein